MIKLVKSETTSSLVNETFESFFGIEDDSNETPIIETEASEGDRVLEEGDDEIETIDPENSLTSEKAFAKFPGISGKSAFERGGKYVRYGELFIINGCDRYFINKILFLKTPHSQIHQLLSISVCLYLECTSNRCE